MSYLDLAAKIGLNLDRLKAGEVIRTAVRANSIEEFKELFAAGLSAEFRASFSRDLAARKAIATPYDRVLMGLGEYVYGTGQMSAEDEALASHTFPITVTVESGADVAISTDVVYGPSASPVFLNYGNLTFDGGSITTQNTVLTLSADSVNVTAAPGNKPYQIGILGVDGAPGTTGSAGNSSSGQANAGSDSQDTSPGFCTFSPDGGAGQQGGNGGLGCNSGCEGSAGGNGGAGGVGGNSGNGGTGGNAVDGNPIFVTVPASAVNSIVHVAQPPSADGAEWGIYIATVRPYPMSQECPRRFERY